MEDNENSQKQPEQISESILEAYTLLGAQTPGELNNLYTAEDQKLFPSGEWDYENSELLINKVKTILENADLSTLNEEEKEWRQEIVWFWYHHAVSIAIMKGDKEKAREFADKALGFKPADNPNQITQLLHLLVHDNLDAAKKWEEEITDNIEKDTARHVIESYENDIFWLPEHLPYETAIFLSKKVADLSDNELRDLLTKAGYSLEQNASWFAMMKKMIHEPQAILTYFETTKD